jgi:hypothetical protein
MEEYLGVAREAGITTREIEAVKHCVMAVAAGQVNAQLQAARQKAPNANRRATQK